MESLSDNKNVKLSESIYTIPINPKAENSKIEIKKETTDSKLAEIGKEAEKVKMEAQLDFLHDHIQEKVDRVSSIQEDENLSELIDKSKMKQMQREIKDLERKKMKMEKISINLKVITIHM